MASLIVKAPKRKRNILPKIPKKKYNFSDFRKFIKPKPINKTIGNSTKVCPRLISKPTFHPLFNPQEAVAAVKGPGAKAPEILIIITFKINSNKFYSN